MRFFFPLPCDRLLQANRHQLSSITIYHHPLQLFFSSSSPPRCRSNRCCYCHCVCCCCSFQTTLYHHLKIVSFFFISSGRQKLPFPSSSAANVLPWPCCPVFVPSSCHCSWVAVDVAATASSCYHRQAATTDASDNHQPAAQRHLEAASSSFPSSRCPATRSLPRVSYSTRLAVAFAGFYGVQASMEASIRS